MTSQPHPTHARYTRLVMVLFFAIAAISWIAAYYAQESLRDQFLVNVSILIFMISGTSLLLTLFARDQLARCPECKHWLRSRGEISKGGTRIVTCVRCGINWDTKVKVSDAGEV